MRRRKGGFLLGVVCVSMAAAGGVSSAQPGGGPPASAEGESAAVPAVEIPGVQLTPGPPRYVPFGTALRERLATAKEQLRVAAEGKAEAVRQGRAAEEIEALDAQIEEWRRHIAAVEAEMEQGNVPAQPVTPRPHTRAVSSTAP